MTSLRCRTGSGAAHKGVRVPGRRNRNAALHNDRPCARHSRDLLPIPSRAQSCREQQIYQTRCTKAHRLLVELREWDRKMARPR